MKELRLIDIIKKCREFNVTGMPDELKDLEFIDDYKNITGGTGLESMCLDATDIDLPMRRLDETDLQFLNMFCDKK